MTREHGDPEPTAAMVLMRERRTTLRAMYVAGRVKGWPAAVRARAVEVMTKEQLVAAILARDER